MEGKWALIVLVAIAAVLLSSTAIVGANVEAKSKKSEIKVYVKDVIKSKFGFESQICIASDDGCLSKYTKTVNLQNKDGKHSTIKVATFNIKFSSNPEDEFGPRDVLACGKLLNAEDCAYGTLKSDGKNKFKATIDFDDLFENAEG